MELRAAFAIASICALVFGLLVSGGSYRSRGETSTQASQGDAHHATCHGYTFGVSKGEAPSSGQKNKADCPCCLAAHAAPAVLPERSGALTRLDRTASPALYLAPSATPRLFAVSQTVNGARAPPRSHSIS